MNSILSTRYPESFTEEDVDKRGSDLADLITEVWSGPTTKPTPVTSQAAPGPPVGRPQPPSPAAPVPHPGRDTIRGLLLSGLDTSETSNRPGGGRGRWLDVLKEGARVTGEMLTRPTPPDHAVTLRNERQMRWERIAARLFGDARRTADAQKLYDQAKGEGAAKRSYTGKGRVFPQMEE